MHLLPTTYICRIFDPIWPLAIYLVLRWAGERGTFCPWEGRAWVRYPVVETAGHLGSIPDLSFLRLGHSAIIPRPPWWLLFPHWPKSSKFQKDTLKLTWSQEGRSWESGEIRSAVEAEGSSLADWHQTPHPWWEGALHSQETVGRRNWSKTEGFVFTQNLALCPTALCLRSFV